MLNDNTVLIAIAVIVLLWYIQPCSERFTTTTGLGMNPERCRYTAHAYLAPHVKDRKKRCRMVRDICGI